MLRREAPSGARGRIQGSTLLGCILSGAFGGSRGPWPRGAACQGRKWLQGSRPSTLEIITFHNGGCRQNSLTGTLLKVSQRDHFGYVLQCSLVRGQASCTTLKDCVCQVLRPEQQVQVTQLTLYRRVDAAPIDQRLWVQPQGSVTHNAWRNPVLRQKAR